MMSSASPLDPTVASCIDHPCLCRKSARIYELYDPQRPDDRVGFDVGQIKEFVQFDGHLRVQAREDPHSIRRSIPSAYAEFAVRFNQYAKGPERFATFSFKHDTRETSINVDGEPIVWDHFLIDDSLVGWVRSASSPAHLDGLDEFVVVRTPEADRKKKELETLVGNRVDLLGQVYQFFRCW